MKGRKLTNSELDELARGLVKSAKPADSDIERIVSNPQLFDGVLSRIAAADVPVHEARPRFAWMPVMAAAAVIFAVSISFVAYIKFAGTNGTIANVAAPQKSPQIFVKEDPRPQYFPPVNEPEEDEPDVPRPVKAVYIKPAPVRAAAEGAKRRMKTPKPEAMKPEAEFYAIGMSERAADAALDGRVVRVDMPRAALFAMGVDIPLENGTRTIKADLLLGSDGTPKAIRLVE